MIKLLENIFNRLTDGETTQSRAVQSGVWVAAINVGDRILQITKIIILARLLSPKAFGLLGIALLFTEALKQISQLGFDEALIHQKQRNINEYLNTIWTIKIIRGLVILIVGVAAAPQVAAIFHEPEASSLIKVISATPLILSLQNPAIIYFQKSLRFEREFIYHIAGRAADLVVAFIIAIIFKSYWALAIGLVSMSGVKLLISYAILDFRPELGFEMKYAKELFDFGKWMFVSSVLLFLYGQGDDAFVGWFFTASALGFYQLAYQFSNAPASEVTQVISRVAFPTFAIVQDDISKLRDGYFTVVQLSSVVAFPMATGIFAISPLFVVVVLGHKWEPMVPLMQMLAIWGGIRAFAANAGPVFKSVGRPDIVTKLQALQTLIILLIIYPFAEYFGLIGVAYSIIVGSLIVQPLSIKYSLIITEGTLRELLSNMSYPLIGSLIMGVIVDQLVNHLFHYRLIGLVISISTGIAIYVLIMLVFDQFTDFELSYLYDKIKSSI